MQAFNLRELCDSSIFSEMQKTEFNKKITEVLARSWTKEEIALFCLHELAIDYDLGGHSCRRSLRSVILEKIIKCLKNGNLENAKHALSIFIAMHYDYKYINLNKWFNYKLEGPRDLPLRSRILVSGAAFALDVNDIPFLDNKSTNDQILDLVNGS